MSQVTHGLRAIFSHPRIYDGFQDLMGASRVREELVREFIRPHPGMKLLDIGCGTAVVLDFLPKTVEYWGFDISERYIAAASRRFFGRGQFHCGLFDAAQLADLPPFDVVIATGLLHHLEDAEARKLFDLTKRALKPNGRMITIDPCLAGGQNPIARFLINSDRGQNVRSSQGYRALPEQHFSQVSGQLRHRSWIPYTHWIMECKA